jgi:aryl-alcohol dehydrogenase-like predicted oxidoreductase
MNIRHVGRTGLRLPTVGLGCNNFGWTIDEAASQKVADRALELGVNFFDTADYYGKQPGDGELVLGRVLGARRKDVTLLTKFGVDMRSNGSVRDSSRGYLMQAVEGSLRRLGTDWIDVYMIHWPDFSTPIEETLRALDDLVRSGKVRYIACSNLAPWRVVDAVWTSRHHGLERFVATQNQYSLLSRGVEADIIPALEQQGLGLLPYYPLANGMLTGKYSRNGDRPAGRLSENFLRLGDAFMTDRNFDMVEALEAFARERGHTLLELAINWLAAQPIVSSIICGATKPEQIEQNVKAAGWALSAEELADVDKITKAA